MAKRKRRINRTIERKLISHAARKASSTAVRVSTTLKLPIQFVRGGKIVMQIADGKTNVIKKVHQVESRVTINKGTKICLQAKD